MQVGENWFIWNTFVECLLGYWSKLERTQQRINTGFCTHQRFGVKREGENDKENNFIVCLVGRKCNKKGDLEGGAEEEGIGTLRR